MTGTLWICGLAWAVDITDRPVIVDGKTVHGVTDKANQHIVVATEGCHDQAVRSSLIHELGHAIFHTVTNCYPEDEEQGVQALECGLFSALTDSRNDWFWSMVRGDKTKKRKGKRGKR